MLSDFFQSVYLAQVERYCQWWPTGWFLCILKSVWRKLKKCTFIYIFQLYIFSECSNNTSYGKILVWDYTRKQENGVEKICFKVRLALTQAMPMNCCALFVYVTVCFVTYHIYSVPYARCKVSVTLKVQSSEIL